MNIYMYHQIDDSAVELCIYIDHTRSFFSWQGYAGYTTQTNVQVD
jgi:hypothetical protein